MQTFITLLRGINVGGKNLIKMQELKNIFADLGFIKVQTYIQSGNIIFDSALCDIFTISEMIAKAIENNFQCKIFVLTLSIAECKEILAQNPFFSYNSNYNIDKLFITFFSDKPEQQYCTKLSEYESEDHFLLTEKCLYLHCTKNYSDTKINNQFIEKQLKIQATTRNVKTIQKIITLAED